MHLIENARQLLRDDRHEDSLTELIESQTELIPSAAFLGFALGAMALSRLFLATGRRNVAHFIGQWAPTILIMGLYNKTVKQHGRG